MSTLLEAFGGIGIALFGAGLAVLLCCIGSAKGTGAGGEAASGLTAQHPEMASKAMILQVLPGTQGLYGLVIWFMAAMKLGIFDGGFIEISINQGFQVFFACLPMAVGGLISAIFQGRVAVAGITMMGKQPQSWSKGLLYCGIVEFYAILSLLASFLMINAISF